MFEEELLLGPPSIRPLLVRLWMGAFDDHLPLLGPLNALGQSQGPIYDLGLCPHKTLILIDLGRSFIIEFLL